MRHDTQARRLNNKMLEGCISTERQEIARRAEYEGASTELRERIERMFWKFEWKHGLAEGEGRTLLLDTGVSL